MLNRDFSAFNGRKILSSTRSNIQIEDCLPEFFSHAYNTVQCWLLFLQSLSQQRTQFIFQVSENVNNRPEAFYGAKGRANDTGELLIEKLGTMRSRCF